MTAIFESDPHDQTGSLGQHGGSNLDLLSLLQSCQSASVSQASVHLPEFIHVTGTNSINWNADGTRAACPEGSCLDTSSWPGGKIAVSSLKSSDYLKEFKSLINSDATEEGASEPDALMTANIERQLQLLLQAQQLELENSGQNANPQFNLSNIDPYSNELLSDDSNKENEITDFTRDLSVNLELSKINNCINSSKSKLQDDFKQYNHFECNNNCDTDRGSSSNDRLEFTTPDSKFSNSGMSTCNYEASDKDRDITVATCRDDNKLMHNYNDIFNSSSTKVANSSETNISRRTIVDVKRNDIDSNNNNQSNNNNTGFMDNNDMNFRNGSAVFTLGSISSMGGTIIMDRGGVKISGSGLKTETSSIGHALSESSDDENTQNTQKHTESLPKSNSQTAKATKSSSKSDKVKPDKAPKSSGGVATSVGGGNTSIVGGARRNERERNRVKQVNLGFDRLRQHVPQGRRNKKLSKVDTLRAAVDYISQLRQLLQLDSIISVLHDTNIPVTSYSEFDDVTDETNSMQQWNNDNEMEQQQQQQQLLEQQFQLQGIHHNSAFLPDRQELFSPMLENSGNLTMSSQDYSGRNRVLQQHTLLQNTTDINVHHQLTTGHQNLSPDRRQHLQQHYLLQQQQQLQEHQIQEQLQQGLQFQTSAFNNQLSLALHNKQQAQLSLTELLFRGDFHHTHHSSQFDGTVSPTSTSSVVSSLGYGSMTGDEGPISRAPAIFHSQPCPITTGEPLPEASMTSPLASRDSTTSRSTIKCESISTTEDDMTSIHAAMYGHEMLESNNIYNDSAIWIQRS